jgi:hypothetical protein
LTREDLPLLTTRFTRNLPPKLAATLALAVLQMIQPRHELSEGFDPRLGKMLAIPIEAKTERPQHTNESTEPPRQLDASKMRPAQGPPRLDASQQSPTW